MIPGPADYFLRNLKQGRRIKIIGVGERGADRFSLSQACRGKIIVIAKLYKVAPTLKHQTKNKKATCT